MAGFFGFNANLPTEDLAPLETGLNEEEEDALNDETFGDFDVAAAGDFSFGAPSTAGSLGGFAGGAQQGQSGIPDTLSSTLTDIIGGGVEDFMDQLLREEDGGSGSFGGAAPGGFLTGKSLFDAAQSWDSNLLTPEQIQSAWGSTPSKNPSIWKSTPAVPDEYQAQDVPVAPAPTYAQRAKQAQQQQQQQQQQQAQVAAAAAPAAAPAPAAADTAAQGGQDKDAVAELLAKLAGAMSVEDFEAKLQKEFAQQEGTQSPSPSPAGPSQQGQGQGVRAPSSPAAVRPQRLRPEEAAALRAKNQQQFSEQMAKLNQGRGYFNQQAGHHHMLLQKVTQQLHQLGQQHHMQQVQAAQGAQQPPKPDPKFEAQRTTLMQQISAHRAGVDTASRKLHEINQQQMFLERQFHEQQIPLLPLPEQKAHYSKQLYGVQQTLNNMVLQMNGLGGELQSLANMYKHVFEKVRNNPNVPQHKMELAGIQQRQQVLARQLHMLAQQKHGAVSFMKTVQGKLKGIEQEEKYEKQAKDPRAQLYNNLMTDEEKTFLVRIQLKQLQSENPYLDDFYYHTLMENRSKEAAALGRPLDASLPIYRQRTIPGARPFRYHTPAAAEYTPNVDASASLGSIAPYNLRTARQLLSGIHGIHKEADGETASEASSRAEAALNWKRKVLLKIEAVYTDIVDLEDIDKRLSNARGENMDDLYAERISMIDGMYRKFGFTEAADQPTDACNEETFLRILSVNKGKKALYRALHFFKARQVASVLTTTIRNIVALSLEDKQGIETLEKSVGGGLSRVVDKLGLADLITALETALATIPSDATQAKECVAEFGGSIVYAITRRADQALSDTNPSPEEAHKWITVLGDYAKAILPVMVSVLESSSAEEAGKKCPYAWAISCFFLAHTGGALNDLFKEKLSALLPAEEARNPPMKQFASYIQGQ